MLSFQNIFFSFSSLHFILNIVSNISMYEINQLLQFIAFVTSKKTFFLSSNLICSSRFFTSLKQFSNEELNFSQNTFVQSNVFFSFFDIN